MTQFGAKDRELRQAVDERRAGFKKVDDEHLIQLAKSTIATTQYNKEKHLKLQRSQIIREAFKKLSEDSLQTKERLKD